MTVSIHVRPRLWASVAGCALTTTIFALPPSAFGAEVLTFDGTSLAGAIAAYDVSDNGTVVVGSFTISSHQHAFRLDGTVFQDLGTIGQTGEASVATGVSADGAVVVGYSYDFSSIAHAFRWTTTAPMADLGFLRDGTYSYARAVSADGAVVVGDSETTGHVDHAFRWSVGHMVDLGTLGGTTSVANDVSADGGVVVGYSTVAGSAAAHAFRWSGGSMVDINGTNSSSIASAVSADGNVVVGYAAAIGASQEKAFRWENGVMQDLGTLTGGLGSIASDVSADGAVVVGYSNFANGSFDAFRWKAATGMQSIKDLLTASGVNMSGWTLINAVGVSGDGTVIVGTGTAPGQGATSSWIARCTNDCSIMTVANATTSFSGLGGLGATGSAYIGSQFDEAGDMADAGKDSGSPITGFASGAFDSDPTASASRRRHLRARQ